MERSTQRRRAGMAGAVLVALVGALPDARAQVAGEGPAARAGEREAAEQAARRGLLEQAEQARNGGDHARALELAERAGRISMSVSLRLMLAQEQRALGRLAEAFGNADLCLREGARDALMSNRETVLATCGALLAELRPTLGSVVVQVPSPAPPGLRVFVAGHELSDALWGVGYFVTPGRVVIEARAEGFVAFRDEVDVRVGQTAEVRAELRADPSAPRGASAGLDAPPGPRDGAAQPVAAGGRGVGIGPVVLLSVGGASLVAAGVFFAMQRVDLASCTNDRCIDQGTIDRIYTETTVMWTTLGIGVAGVGAGLAWYFVDRGASASSAAAPARRSVLAPVPVPLHGGAGLAVHGWF